MWSILFRLATWRAEDATDSPNSRITSGELKSMHLTRLVTKSYHKRNSRLVSFQLLLLRKV